jgi:hypothetical protein
VLREDITADVQVYYSGAVGAMLVFGTSLQITIVVMPLLS